MVIDCIENNKEIKDLDYSKGKAALFQYMASFVIITRVLFTPTGLFLYTFLDGGVILAIAGFFFVISVIPLVFLKEEPTKPL